MEAFNFLLKIALFTGLVVWGMQYKYDEKTLESHFVEFVHGSTMTEPIHKVAQGARQAGSDGWAKVKELIGSTGSSGADKKKSEPERARRASTFKWQGE